MKKNESPHISGIIGCRLQGIQCMFGKTDAIDNTFKKENLIIKAAQLRQLKKNFKKNYFKVFIQTAR